MNKDSNQMDDDETAPAAWLDPDKPISIESDSLNRRTIISGTDVEGAKVKIITPWAGE
jgi:hypothetical protein